MANPANTSGTHANRPTAQNSVEGQTYFETDTKTDWAFRGGAWHEGVIGPAHVHPITDVLGLEARLTAIEGRVTTLEA